MMTSRRLLLLAPLLLRAASGALAQPAPGIAVRLRGTIDVVGAGTLDLTLRDGSKAHVLLPDDVRVTSVVAAKLSDIQPGSFIGTAAMPQPDGTQRALEVHVFPPSMRGRGEGSRPFDLEGGASTMTNGTVGSLVTTNGGVATVRYGDGEKRILIPDDVPVVSFEPGDRASLLPGAKVIVTANRAADGVIIASSINVGKDGLTPPM